jgi:hypothetical protein
MLVGDGTRCVRQPQISYTCVQICVVYSQGFVVACLQLPSLVIQNISHERQSAIDFQIINRIGHLKNKGMPHKV